MSIAVCALTYKRPQGLSRLLEGLSALSFSNQTPAIRLIIVDNDPSGSARELCGSFASRCPWEIQYVVETKRGIAHARNAALENARTSEWIAFIDDDEVTAADWLEQLIQVRDECQADVVFGPVVPYFEVVPPAWLIAGKFMDCPRYKNGEQLDHAYTNNVLFRSSILEEIGICFDPRWALMGCEDLHFFRSVAKSGYRIIWADQATVTEWIPPTRATARWIWQRAYRYGNSDACVEREVFGRDNPRGNLLVRAAKRIIVGMITAPFSWLFGRYRFVRSIRHVCYGMGILSGCAGVHYKEYRRTHGG
ncbi:MAG: glycosyltransferase family 2 protein [Planctomycetota bacterium]|jgi:GT2 family glycosyltransferase